MRPSIATASLFLLAGGLPSGAQPGALADLTGDGVEGDAVHRPPLEFRAQAGQGGTKRPNIVIILTDDQDLHLGSLDYLPLVRKNLIVPGTTYTRHYCTTAICCPSRVTLWTGKLAHNTNVTDVNPPYGGYPKFTSQGLNSNYLPVWLQQAGYNTYYTGKLFNAHSVSNYNSPFPAGWNHSDFLLDPYTYAYLNATFQRDRDPPRSYGGQYSVDVLAAKALGFLDDAAAASKQEGGRPFFIGLAPIAPHSNANRLGSGFGEPPIPAERHRDLFPNATVPRTLNFNPGRPSGAAWVSRLRRLSRENVDYNDHYYRQRLRALQSVDELVDGVVASLERHGVLDNTYVIYTSDNGFHIGQHRLPPGKTCGYEEDVNVPLVVRGPGVPAGHVAEVVTAHVDLAPTILTLAGAPLGADFDGAPIPLSQSALEVAAKGRGDDGAPRQEQLSVEFWGRGIAEGKYDFNGTEPGGDAARNNTYKAVRVIGPSFNLYYSVWCSGEHELYDMSRDPYQMNNLLRDGEESASATGTDVGGFELDKLVPRLDALLLVLKSCKGETCVRPWQALHPQGDVTTLSEALSPSFDGFYEVQQKRVAFSRCEAGQILDAEGPQFQTDGVAYREGSPWYEWV